MQALRTLKSETASLGMVMLVRATGKSNVLRNVIVLTCRVKGASVTRNTVSMPGISNALHHRDVNKYRLARASQRQHTLW